MCEIKTMAHGMMGCRLARGVTPNTARSHPKYWEESPSHPKYCKESPQILRGVTVSHPKYWEESPQILRGDGGVTP